jgi:SAM-dependent methyltransferase
MIEPATIDLPPILDACCGPRLFWFDRKDPRALFIDKRRETHPIDVGTPGTVGRNPIVVDPDHIADFSAMPFADESFHLVVFDPPHVQRKEARGIVTRKYGVLNGNWREMLRQGFVECFRILKPNGTLVFKWSESQFPVREILALTPEKPLFGHHTGKNTHWCVFMKQPSTSSENPTDR